MGSRPADRAPHRVRARLLALLPLLLVALAAPALAGRPAAAAPGLQPAVLPWFSVEAEDPEQPGLTAVTQRKDVFVLDSYENDIVSYYGSVSVAGNVPTPYRVTANGNVTDFRYTWRGSGSCRLSGASQVYCTGSISEIGISAYWRASSPLREDGSFAFVVGGTSRPASDYSLDMRYLPEFSLVSATPPPTAQANSLVSWQVPEMSSFSAQLLLQTQPGQVQIDADYPLDGRYLPDVRAENLVRVKVDWQDAGPGNVYLVLNDQTFTMRPNPDRSVYEAKLDMGSSLEPGLNHLSITVYDANGEEVEAKTFDPCQAAVPGWMSGLRGLGALNQVVLEPGDSSYVSYKSALVLPLKPLKLNLPLRGLPIDDAGVQFNLSSALDVPIDRRKAMEIDAALAANISVPKIRLYGMDLAGKVTLNGKAVGQPRGCDLANPAGTYGVDVEASGTLDAPVFLFVGGYISPGLALAFSNYLEDKGFELAKIPLGKVYLEGKLIGGFQSPTEFRDAFPHAYFIRPKLSGGMGVETGYSWDATVFEVTVYLGAEGSFTWQLTGETGALDGLLPDQATLKGEAGVRVHVLLWDFSLVAEIEGSYPAQIDMAALPYRSQSVLIPPPDPADDERFFDTPAAARAFTATLPDEAAALLAGAQTSTLATNLYRYAEPALSTHPGSQYAMLTWVYNDPARPAGQSHEIRYSFWDGSRWSAPANLTNDGLADLRPEIAWTDFNTAVAVWHRVKRELSPNSEWDAATAGAMEIATSTFNRSTGTWSPVQLLSNNSTLDHTPQLVRGSGGRLLAVWRANNSPRLIGSAQQPDRIMYAFYDGGWSAPKTLVSSVPGLLDVGVGIRDQAATVVYTQAAATAGKTELLASTWNGAAWSAPRRLLPDAGDYRNPQAIYTSDNQATVGWYDGAAFRTRNQTTGAQTALTLPAPLRQVNRLKFLRDSLNNMMVVFSVQTEQRDLYMARYDLAAKRWGAPVALTADDNAERYFSAALDQNDRLVVGYSSTPVELSDGGVPQERATELRTLSYTFAPNLTLADSDLSVSPDRPGAGQLVRLNALLQNTGDIPVRPAVVSFYDGPPATGALLGKATIAELNAHSRQVVGIDYRLPNPSGPRTIYAVVDAEGALAESNEQDNQARLSTFGPDLVLQGAEARPAGGSSVRLLTEVRNNGTAPTPRTSVRFYREGTTAPVTVGSVPPLAPGERRLVETSWSYGTLASGLYQLRAVANESGSDFAELDRANNEADLALSVLTDVEVSDAGLRITPGAGGRAQVRATLSNPSLIGAPAFTVTLYVDEPLAPDKQVKTWQVSGLNALRSVALSADIPIAGTRTYYLVIDPQLQLQETSRSNNYARATVRAPAQAGFQIYLPQLRLR